MGNRKRRSDQIDRELQGEPDAISDGPFTKGAIIRVKLRNFMTYKRVELHAGPYLNMVLGPNGTGKSALVCAMIVGLGGDPSATGRSGSLSEYIRFGCPHATTEIELFNPNGDNHIIKRKLISLVADGHCKTEWTLNNVPKKGAEIKELISSLNIRVSNLCQFLPQEKVVEFARMDSVQLLENTQKAAGDENMFIWHEKLIFCSKKINDLKKKKSSLDQQLVTDQHLTDRMVEQVERVREKEQFKEKMSWLRKKLPWLEFEEVRQEYVKAKTVLEKKLKEFDKNKSKNKPLEDKVANEKKTMEKASADTKSALNELKSVTATAALHKKEYDKLSDKIAEALAALDGKKKAEESRLVELSKLNSEKKLLQERLAAASDEDVSENIKTIDSEISTKNSLLKQLTTQKDQIVSDIEKLRDQYRQLKGEFEQIHNVASRRRDLLRRIEPKVAEASDWLRRNKEKFSRMIYEPIMTQINVKNAEWIRYVEATIPRRDLVAFVCEDIDDLKKFTTLLKRESLNVNVVQAPGQDDVNMDPRLSLDNISPYGFKHYIKDLFDAPPPITRYLCKNYNLQNVPIGGNDVDSKRFLKENNQIQRFFCGNTSHSWTVSRYDREKVISTDRLKDPSLLVMIIDSVRKDQIESKINNIRTSGQKLDSERLALDEKITDLRRELVTLRDTRKQLLEKRDEKRAIQTRIQQKSEQIERKMKDSINLEVEKSETKTIIESLVIKKIEKLELFERALEKCVTINTKKLASDVMANCSQKRFARAKENLDKANVAFETFATEIEELKMVRDEKKKIAKERQKEAQIAVDCQGQELPTTVKEKFKPLPDTIVEINAEMRRLALQMNSMEEFCDDTVLNDYNEQKNAVKKRKKEIDLVSADLKLMESDLENYRNRWKPAVEALISRIDKNFSKFMSRLEYAGEVSLSHGDDVDDFSTYGICIKVRYRDNEVLKELSAFHQSGGERSVATMIYMIALQELTKVPFRIVDEINQGMDDTNERRVFDLIVETASTNSSQYFLFSPKLLQKLTYTNRMHIHIIFNGPKFEVDWHKCKSVKKIKRPTTQLVVRPTI
ncbi:structural maintenance of chromosomes protein 5-like [Panonychus citri]|uniref:structural maintenance of chromosomes protein 5-like n=1 Tax=Panonychus citri TaxID=50023 RepID=UPI00230791E5|nr:structural maintenance of chromosomes protein 5-like [Panonychus citri]